MNWPERKKVLFLYAQGSTRESLSVSGSILSHLRANENEVTVLDVTDFGVARHGLPPQFLLRMLRVPQNTFDFRKHVLELNFEYLKVERPPGTRKFLKPLPTEEIRDSFEESIESAILSYFRVAESPRSQFSEALRKRLVGEGQYLFNFISNLLAQQGRFDLVVNPNGRLPSQRVVSLAAQFAETDILFYEIGRMTRGTFYIGPRRVHDRIGTQQDVIQGAPIENSLEIASEWLKERMRPKSDTNQFSDNWDISSVDPLSTPGDDGLDRALIFTSSADEFVSLGAEWNLQEWGDQYEAFGEILGKLSLLGIPVTLRVHPNLVNKHPHHFWGEIKKIRRLMRSHRELDVVWPNEKVNSYALVRKAKIVIVARSTIGLEASLMGKSVWTVTPSRYDLVADVKRIWSSSDLIQENFEPWEVSRIVASRLITSFIKADLPFSQFFDGIIGWDASRPPRRVRLANIFIKNTMRHRAHVIFLELSSRIQQRIPLSWLAKLGN
jgi:hypothetical protein